MSKIYAFGSKIVVNRDKKSTGKGFVVVGSSEVYVTGQIISMGSLFASDLFSDGGSTLAAGSTIVYPAHKANSLGLDFPETYDVVEAEDVVGLVLPEKEDDKLST